LVARVGDHSTRSAAAFPKAMSERDGCQESSTMGYVAKKSLKVETTNAPVTVPNLDSHLCFALYAASNHMTRLFTPFLQKLGVTYSQYLVLVVLWERGPQGVGDLASLVRMDFGTLSPLLKRLEAKGLVSRQRQSTDERRVLVDLTPKSVSLRKQTEQMLGDFYCYLNMPLEELFDLRDRLQHFVGSAGPAKLEKMSG
jgi:MarR family transcriptional regulator, organic hydroperoxide resistance regulator